jgi:O-antigen ligase
MAVALAPALPRTAATERPGVALGLAALGIVLLPLLVPSLPGNAAPVDVILLLSAAATLLWAGWAGHRLRLPYVLPVALLVTAGSIAALLGHYPVRGALTVAQDLMLLAWCAVVANLMRTPEAARVLLRAWVWSATAWAAILVLAVAAGLSSVGGFSEQGGRAELTFGNPNLAGNYFAISLLVLWAGPRPRRTVVLLAATALLIAAILFTGSNSAIGGVVAGFLVAFVVSVTRKRGLIAALAVGVIMVSVAVLTSLSIQTDDLLGAARESSSAVVRNSIGRTERSGEGRVVHYWQLIHLYREGGILGQGPATTKEVLADRGAPDIKEAHNDYIGVLVERGVFGGLGLILLIGSVGLRAARLGEGLDDRYRRAVRSTYPLMGACLAVAIGSVFHELLHYRHVWTLLGIVAGLHLWGRATRSDRSPA